MKYNSKYNLKSPYKFLYTLEINILFQFKCKSSPNAPNAASQPSFELLNSLLSIDIHLVTIGPFVAILYVIFVTNILLHFLLVNNKIWFVVNSDIMPFHC